MGPRVRSRAWAGLLLSLAVCLPAQGLVLESPAGTAVAGRDVVAAELSRGVAVRSYRNNGYQAEVHGRQVAVTVDLAPLESLEPFPPPPPCPGSHRRQDALCRLARAVTMGSKTRHQAVSRLLGWMSQNITYSLDREEPQDAQSVLHRRSAYCTGIARLGVALLEAVGLEAREVPGIVLDGAMGQGRFHRWIEVYYPDRGWVFSDPLVSHHFVPATYLPLASEKVSRRLSWSPALLLERRDLTFAVDLYPASSSGLVRARKNSPRQLSGALEVAVGLRPGDVLELEGGGLKRRLVLAEKGFATFLGVEPGSYTLRMFSSGSLEVERPIRMSERALRRIDFRRNLGRIP